MKMIVGILSGFIVGAIVIYFMTLGKDKLLLLLDTTKIKPSISVYVIAILLMLPIVLHLVLALISLLK